MGIVVTLFGRKSFEVTIFATGAISGFIITLILFSMLSMLDSFSNREEVKQKQSLSFTETMFSYVFSIVIGVFVGFILTKMLRVGAAIMGAIGGLFAGLTLAGLLFFWTDSPIPFYVLSTIGVIAMAILSLRHYDNIVIIGTSMLGSYCFVRGFSLFIGGFPPENTIVDTFIKGDFTTEFIIYIALFIITTAVGIFYQRRQKTIESLNNYIKM
jgi:hypothetical protein